MNTHPIPLLALVCLPCLLLSYEEPALKRLKPTEQKSPVTASAAGRVSDTYGRIALSFEANRGQTDESVDFVARGPGYALFLTPGEAVFRLKNAENSATLRMKLIGADVNAKANKMEELAGKVNYFIGSDPAQWRQDVPTYGRVRYRNIYPGIDLVYYGNQRQLEYDFVIAPGADWRRIALAFDGAEKIEIEPATGDLLLQVEDEIVRQAKPIVYQEVDGERRVVEASYRMRERRRVGFAVGEHDKSKPLVIDPVLVYSSYLGGTENDSAGDIAVDSDGSVYLTGTTLSANFPTSGGVQSRPGTGFGIDAFVTKINPAGDGFAYSTYLGGTSQDTGLGIAIDASGNAYVVGMTTSTDFPTAAPIQSASGGGEDVFVTKINAAGNALIYSTYLGGNGIDDGPRVAVDLSNNAYVAGRTGISQSSSSPSPNFPTVNPIQGTFGGGFTDGFVAKVNGAGSALVYSTYLGGSEEDSAEDIALDADGNPYICGATRSSNFPLANALQSSKGNAGIGEDAFVTKINAAGTTLVYSTFLGGDGTDVGYAIALNSSGDAYIAGNTTSANFPTLNPIQAAKADTDQGAFDAFVSRINAAGTALVYSTYLGGPFTPGLSQDIASGIAVAPSGDAYVIGTTGSQSFPTVNAFQDTTGGDDDAFVLRINAAGTALVFSSYLGGSSSENGSGIAVDSSGNAYVTGGTLSNNFPTVNPFQASKGGQFQFDAFVAKIGEGSAEVVATLGNIATRMRVLTEDRALIGGFIITGSDPKRVIIRGIGPSLAGFVADALANPTLELFDANSALLASNDDWKSNQAEVEATTIPPSNDLESAIVKTLAPAAYTAVLRGQNNATGIGVVEVYDLDNAANSTLANISSRGFVDSGDNVMIGGFIVGGGNAEARVLVRGIGPSLAGFVADALANPTLELRDGNGSLIRANDNWRESQEAEIQDTTIPPTNDLESAIVASVGNGNYTAILRGKDDTTGVAVVEVYNLQ